MTKFKVGDKVKVRSWGDMERDYGLDLWGDIKILGTSCCFVKGMKEWCGKILTIEEVHGSDYRVKETGWWWIDEMFEIPSHTIVIYEKDNKVIALDKVTGETAEAICNPDDKFDFYVGADLAFERLRGRKPAPKMREETPKFFTGEMICIKSASKYYTLGKIYKVKNGQWKDNDGDMNLSKYESVEQINESYSSQFIEVIR